MSDRLQRYEAILAALALAAVAALFAYAAGGLRGDAGRFPQLVGGITAALALAEALARALAARAYGAPPRSPRAVRWRAALLLAWFAGTLAGLYLLGVVAGTALCAAVYFRLFAGLRLLPALAGGATLAAFFYLGFGLMAGFRLHPGTLPLPWL